MYVTFKARNLSKPITKQVSTSSIQGRVVNVTLTQAESLQLHDGDLEIQANWTTTWGERMASEITIFPFTKQLLLEEIE